MAERSNNSITSYKDLDVPHHIFDNSMAAVEGYKAKRTRDDYDEVGSSNNKPHPEIMAHSNSDCEE